ncbi:MAG: DoxX family protein [Deltaproteobacteria bacterium]|nr:DoxX family protein [Deltaproteobacteria bacterium]
MLEKIFGPYRDYSLFVLRLFVGIVFLVHGSLKLFGGLEGFTEFLLDYGIPYPEIMAPTVGAIEFIGGLAILLGTGTRIASFLLTGIMVVAMITVTLPAGFAGGYDANLALLGGLLALLLAGPGKPAVGGDL